MSETTSTHFSRNFLARSELVILLRTALATNSLRFARQAALAWLAHYPGDLPVNRLYAQVLLQARLTSEARQLLDHACRVDPEDCQSWELLAAVVQRHEDDDQLQSASAYQLADCRAALYALGSQIHTPTLPPAWSQGLLKARQAMAEGKPEQAEHFVHQSLLVETIPPLVGITHLLVAYMRKLPARAIHDLADFYHERFPESLVPLLILAEALMEGGQADRGVALLHQASAQDVTGQVAVRLWGEDHPYRNLWPERLETPWVIPIPAEVAAALGWNRLPAGTFDGEATQPISVRLAEVGAATVMAATRQTPVPKASRQVSPVAPTITIATTAALITPPPEEILPDSRTAITQAVIPEALRSVQVELERIANNLGRGPLARSDGRFPVYVILTTRYGLSRQYGEQHMALIDGALQLLRNAVASRRDWNAILLYADDPDCAATCQLQPAHPRDPWSLKLALADLDAFLSHKGEMIGALLIVGGPEVVPFHKLPNPVDDEDVEIDSDNPYTTRDANYFIPEWPVGRLPAGTGSDPALLVKLLGGITDQHVRLARSRPRRMRWWTNLRSRFSGRRRRRQSWGYTAAVWRRASLSVYRPIGDPGSMLVSPPAEAESINGKSRKNGVMPPAHLTYFNLHGLRDASEWYGQRDPSDPTDQPDYPIALRPADVVNGGKAPQVVFSEACYGAHINGKVIESALALKFLGSGSQVVVGSTCTAYGAVTTPLIAGDLLGQSFWKYLNEGLPAGEALRRAKISLAREMHRRQGYLDGEDQKTLISFVLYGDPLANTTEANQGAKRVLRQLHPPANIRTVCERSVSPSQSGRPVPHTLQQPPDIPEEALAQIKKAVEQYLPGMLDASLTVSQSKSACTGEGHACPTSVFQAKSSALPQPEGSVVTLSKQVTTTSTDAGSGLVHRHYARLTLDPHGQVVKVAVSR